MTTRTPLDQLITHGALSQIVENDFMQRMTDELADSAEPPLQLKNVCAKVSMELSDEIDSICDLLRISKRKFLEAAFIEAVEKAKAIIEAEGVYEYLSALGQATTKR